MRARSRLRRTNRANRHTRWARSAPLREGPAVCFASEHALAHNALEILTVPGFAEGLREAAELLAIDEALAERDFLRAADFQALPRFDSLHEVGGGEQRSVGAGVEPCDTAPEDLDTQRATLEIGTVDVRDLELAAGRGAEAARNTHAAGVIEI